MKNMRFLFISVMFSISICSFTQTNENKSATKPSEDLEHENLFNPFKNRFFIEAGAGRGGSAFWETYKYNSFNVKIGNRWMLNKNDITVKKDSYQTEIAFQLTWISFSENWSLHPTYDKVEQTASIAGVALTSVSKFRNHANLEIGLGISPRVKIMKLDNDKFYGLRGNIEARFGYKRFYMSFDAGLSITLWLFGVSTGFGFGVYI